MCFLQAVGTFEAALKRLKDAGVELVKFDMGLLSAEGAEVEAELLLAYEAPREIARCGANLYCIVSSPDTIAVYSSSSCPSGRHWSIQGRPQPSPTPRLFLFSFIHYFPSSY